jgi:hypothetical protein
LQITNPPPVTLSSDAPGNTFCNNETVNFSVSSQIAGAQYSFYVGGKLEQGPNALSQFSTQNLADNDIVSVEVNNSGCISQASVQVFLNNITDSGSIGFVTATNPVAPQQICYGSSPPMIGSTSTPTIEGVAVLNLSQDLQLGQLAFGLS